MFAGDGRLLSFARRGYGLMRVAAEVAEEDPEQWLSSTADAIREAASDLDLRGVRASASADRARPLCWSTPRVGQCGPL